MEARNVAIRGVVSTRTGSNFRGKLIVLVHNSLLGHQSLKL